MPGEGDVAGVALGSAGVAVGAAGACSGVAVGAAGAAGAFSGVAVGAAGGAAVGVGDASGLAVGAGFSPQPPINNPAIAAATGTKKGVFMPRSLDAGVESVFTGGTSPE